METTQVATEVERQYFDLPTAARYLCVSVRAIRELIWQGYLPRARIGKRFIVARADLDAIVSRRMEFEIDAKKQAKNGPHVCK